MYFLWWDNWCFPSVLLLFSKFLWWAGINSITGNIYVRSPEVPLSFGIRSSCPGMMGRTLPEPWANILLSSHKSFPIGSTNILLWFAPLWSRTVFSFSAYLTLLLKLLFKFCLLKESPQFWESSNLPYSTMLVLFFFSFFATPTAYGSSQPGIKSKPQLRPMPQLQQCWIFNPLCLVRDQIALPQKTIPDL